MKKLSLNQMTQQAVIAAIYVVLTLSAGDLSFGPVQFRYSEILNLLAFYNPLNVLGITLGVFISNLWSTLGWPDLIFGTLHTFISLYLISKTNISKNRTINLLIASLWPTIFAFIIGFELSVIAKFDSFFIMTYQVMISEFVIMTIISVPVYLLLEKYKEFINLIGDDYRLKQINLR